jgi:predicted transposase YdaD
MVPRLLQAGLSLKKIAEVLELPLEDVRQITQTK